LIIVSIFVWKFTKKSIFSLLCWMWELMDPILSSRRLEECMTSKSLQLKRRQILYYPSNKEKRQKVSKICRKPSEGCIISRSLNWYFQKNLLAYGKTVGFHSSSLDILLQTCLNKNFLTKINKLLNFKLIKTFNEL
jgi:hypothetical protein